MTRKVRSDKKKDIKPTISNDLKRCIYSLAFISDRPIKNVIEEILIHGCYRQETMQRISNYFIRDIRIHDTLYIGKEDAEKVTRSDGPTIRVHTRVSKTFYSELEPIAYSIGCPVATLCGLILYVTIKDVSFMDDFAEQYIEDSLDNDRRKELKEIAKYINEDRKEGSLINRLIDRFKPVPDQPIFVINKWDEND